ncbi:hypothetical protein A5889_001486 [Enterococcus sp. 9D6_DIV0238]|uniref:Bacterial Ig domain-containing protein n=2 Tax=Enterococcus TaxID=1350 RepID=A0A200J6P2_9ENTE|nr:hypothetical protein A5889_001592 [Enterococcus sp. 9D6_DIV0238]
MFMKKMSKYFCLVGLLFVACTLFIPGSASAKNENVSYLQVPAELSMQESSLVKPDSFRLGLDDYVTGIIDSSIKKVVLYVNDQMIRNGAVYSDGTFDIEAGDAITKMSDKVEVVGLDRKNVELDRQIVSIEQSKINFYVDYFTLFDKEIKGSADSQVGVVSLLVNDELIRSVAVNADDTFEIPVEVGEIIETEDIVEVVGSNSGKELVRVTVPVNPLYLEAEITDFILGQDNNIVGYVSEDSSYPKAKQVQLYVNRKRYGKAALTNDGQFSVNTERNITNPNDTVVIAVLDEDGQELGRFPVKILGYFGDVKWSWDEEEQSVTFEGGTFPATNQEFNISREIGSSNRITEIKKLIFTDAVEADRESSYLFYGLDRLETFEGLDYLDVSSVENMAYMFSFVSVPELDLSNWDTRNVQSMERMFNSSRSITHLELGDFNTSNVTNMSGMFSTLNKITDLDLSFFDTSQVTDMNHMFQDMTSLTNLNLAGFDTSQVTNMNGMFGGMIRISKLEVNHFDTSKVTDMAYMFHRTAPLKELNLSNFDTSQVTRMDYMFACKNSNHQNLESQMTSLDISNFDTSNVKSMNSMFAKLLKLEQLDISHFNTSNVTDMAYMFYELDNLKELDVSKFDTSNVTDMTGMFLSPFQNSITKKNAIETLNISGFNTSNVTKMGGIFSGLTSLKELDVRHFDTSKVTLMNSMFYNLKDLKTIDLSNFDTRNATNMTGMFEYTTNLDTMVLGPNTIFQNTVKLPEKTTSPYTGKWTGPSISGTHPVEYDSSLSLVNEYDGALPGTYIREVQ